MSRRRLAGLAGRTIPGCGRDGWDPILAVRVLAGNWGNLVIWVILAGTPAGILAGIIVNLGYICKHYWGISVSTTGVLV